MILLFLGSWRSTLIIAVSIPLSILTSLIVLSALGETINIMTLGGLALAVGILVDDATVEIENINRNSPWAKRSSRRFWTAPRRSPCRLLFPRSAICIVFVPMFFLTGVARYLFVPLAEAVVFAMLASYLLSRTLVPTMARVSAARPRGTMRARSHASSRNPFGAPAARASSRPSSGFAGIPAACSKPAFDTGASCRSAFWVLRRLPLLLLPWLGQDFFPRGRQRPVHACIMRAPTGTRIEETARALRSRRSSDPQADPAREISSIIDNIGLPYQQHQSFLQQLGAHRLRGRRYSGLALRRSTARPVEYVHDLRLKLAEEFPGVTFYFLPADMVSQILNFGFPAPIDIQVVGQRSSTPTGASPTSLLEQLKSIPGSRRSAHSAALQPAATARRCGPHQSAAGRLHAAGRCQRLARFAERELSNCRPLSGWTRRLASATASPTQTPAIPRRIRCRTCENIPLRARRQRPAADPCESGIHQPRLGMAAVSHYNVQPVIDIYGSVQGRDLGGVAREIDRIVNAEPEGACRAGRSSSCAARLKPCGRRSSACWAGWSSPLSWSIC